MGKKKRIAEPKAKKGNRFSAEQPQSYDDKHLAFSLNRVQCNSGFCYSDLENECKQAFADAIFKRKDITWKDLRSLPRHGLGSEKINTNSIKAPLPHFITEDQETLLAFRYNGKKAMVGYRVRDIFFVLWFDPQFQLYEH